MGKFALHFLLTIIIIIIYLLIVIIILEQSESIRTSVSYQYYKYTLQASESGTLCESDYYTLLTEAKHER